MPITRAQTRLGLLALLIIAAVAVGCGTANSHSAGNATDAAFITDMTAHHRGTIEIADVAMRRAQHSQIRKLAGEVRALQTGEIALMQRIGEDMQSMGMRHPGHMGLSRRAMGTDVDLPTLALARQFDRAFIDVMIRHHQGAIAMARRELARGSQPALRALARDVITTQAHEVAQMRAWRARWFTAATG